MPIPVISLTALVMVNLVPLIGALLLGWKVGDILLLFWLENVVIGVFNVLRMGVRMVTALDWSALFLVPFFVMHYGIFCAGHGFFLFTMFHAGEGVPGPSSFSLGGVVELVRGLIQQPAMFWGLIGLTLSHGVSFVMNFLIGGEFRTTDTRTLMGQPYVRIMILHVVIIVGAILVLQLGQPVWALALLVAVKIGVDVAAHLSERRKLSAAKRSAP
jgi:hypothetical protein